MFATKINTYVGTPNLLNIIDNPDTPKQTIPYWSKNTLNEIPSWIIKSVITNLRLGSGINYTNQIIDDLKNISNLKYLTIDSSLVTDIPNSYVEILTLQYL